MICCGEAGRRRNRCTVLAFGTSNIQRSMIGNGVLFRTTFDDDCICRKRVKAPVVCRNGVLFRTMFDENVVDFLEE